MKKLRFINSVLLGTILLFGYKAISWGVLPFHESLINNIENNFLSDDITAKQNLKDGIYHYPGLSDDIEETKAKLLTETRITFMVVKNPPGEIFSIKRILMSVINDLLTVILLMMMIWIMNIRTLKKILILFVIVGVIITTSSELPFVTWFYLPIKYAFVNLCDHIASFFLLALLFGYYTFSKTETN